MIKYLFLFALFWHQGVFAQSEDLTLHTNFLETRVDTINLWLSNNNIPTNLLTAKSVSVKKNKVTLLMKVKDKHHWNRLNIENKSSYRKSFHRILFEKFAFQSDLQRSQLEIEIEGIDAIIFLYFEHTEILEEIMEKMGEVADNHEIPLKDISYLMRSDSITTNRVKDIKTTITTALDEYFRPYTTEFNPYNFNIISSLGNELIIDIRNVKNVILDAGYFEYIRISMEFREKPNNIELKYRIWGKYGSGILWAPKRSDYIDMEPAYTAELNEFSLIFKNKIHNILTTKT